MNSIIESLNHAAAVWLPYVTHATWQSVLVSGGLLLVVWLGRRLSSTMNQIKSQ